MKKIRRLYIKLQSSYVRHKKIVEIEKRAGLRENYYLTLKRKWRIYKQYRRAYIIGKRAAQGYNVYITFGSAKTVCKDAQDSYKRHAMAMNHYNQVVCDESSFVKGYKKQQSGLF